MSIELLGFQKRGVKKLHHFNGRALLADEMGLGKTIQFLQYAKECPDARPIVIVCPAFLKWNWEEEAKSKFGLRATVLEGRKAPRKLPLIRSPLIIINYDILSGWLDYLIRLKPGLVGVDECHYIKSRSAKRTKAVKQLCKHCKKVVMISGTPLTNRPAELWTSLNILKPKRYPSFWSYAVRYCAPKRKPWGWEYKGASNLPELHEKLKEDCMIRRLKKNVLGSLPSMRRIIVPMEVDGIEEYQEAEREFIQWLAKQRVSKRALKKAMKAEAVVRMGHLIRFATRLKMPSVIQWTDNYLEASEDKIILFAHHKFAIKTLLDKYGGMATVVDGNTPKDQRRKRVKMFSESRRTRIMIAQNQSAGVGWSGVAAPVCGMVEMPWTPGECSQLEARIDRIGQVQSTYAYYFAAKGTIETKRCQMLQTKQQTLDSVLDGADRGEFNIYDELLASFERRVR